jgi:putative ABC transport system permease protein
VLMALLFATATMMMQSIRERIPELGVLKTIGFSDQMVFLLILCEATLVFVLAGAFGLALANLVFPWAARFVPGLSMPAAIVVAGLAAAAILALISTAVPATLAARLKVVTALRAR